MKTKLTLAESDILIKLGIDKGLASECVSVIGIVNRPKAIIKLPEPKPIFTLSDLLSILPEEIVADTPRRKNDSCILDMSWNSHSKKWHTVYCCLPCPHGVGDAPELIDALFQLLIWCANEGHIKR